MTPEIIDILEKATRTVIWGYTEIPLEDQPEAFSDLYTSAPFGQFKMVLRYEYMGDVPKYFVQLCLLDGSVVQECTFSTARHYSREDYRKVESLRVEIQSGLDRDFIRQEAWDALESLSD